MKFETERLIIRPVQKGDELILTEMAKDGSFEELGFDADCSEWIGEWIEEAVTLAEKDDPRVDYICSIVCLKDGEEVIGTVGNTYYEDTEKIGICYGIGAKYRQKGYASEAVKAYLEFFFDHYDEEEIIATILDDNISSCKTAERSGFELQDTRMYQDIYDTEERLYRFYSAFRREAKYQEVIETERLTMRRLLPEDYQAMAAWDMDERVYKYLLGSACKTPEEPLAWLPKKDPTSKVNILMLVTAKEDGHAVGIYALNHDLERDVWTLSYVNRYDDWGKGYTVEGMKALMQHAVVVYGARTFEGECAKVNTGSRKVMEKLGMVYDHSSSYTKTDGSATFESDIYTLTVD